jgi:hypothetical protein
VTEDEFGIRLARLLKAKIPKKYTIETKRSLLYAVSFDDAGRLTLGQNAAREPVRGGGTGFEQDLLIFQRTSAGDTAIVPRVSMELKFGGVTTHDAIVYSEKARRIRSIYPFVRYGVVLGDLKKIPPRTLRLGAEFDFIIALPAPITSTSVAQVAKLIRIELRLSQRMTDVLQGREDITILHRSVRYTAAKR